MGGTGGRRRFFPLSLLAAALPLFAQNPYVIVDGTLQGPNGLPVSKRISIEQY
jgi:hypothetical protein